MEQITKKTCARCYNEITISMDNIDDVDFLKYNGKCYHKHCFIEYANERVAKRNRYSLNWQMAIDNVDTYVAEARKAVKTTLNRDALNVYLIENYDVATLSSYFWNVVSEIENGVYRKKHCKPISTGELLNMWKFYQKELNDIQKYNATHGNEMSGEGRVRYDLAIIMANYAKIKKGIAKERAARAQAITIEEQQIDYTRFSKTKLEQKRDISDLFGQFQQRR